MVTDKAFWKATNDGNDRSVSGREGHLVSIWTRFAVKTNPCPLHDERGLV